MKNIKVRVKLILSFSIVVALAIIVALVGIIGMSQINAADDVLYNSNVIALEALGSIRENFASQQMEIRVLIIRDSTAPQYKTAHERLGTLRNEMQEHIALYTPTANTKEDQDTLERFIKYYDAYQQALDDMILLTNVNEVDEALDILDNVGAPAAAEASRALAEAAAFNNTAAKKSVDSNTTLFNTMTIIEIAVLAAAIAIAGFLALYVSGMISKPLGVLTAFMNKAGTTGDISLSQQDVEIIEKIARNKDETGQCIDSTAKFVEHLIVISGELEKVAGGDLTVDINMLSEKDTMGVSMKKMVDNLNSMFGDIRSASDQVSSGAGQVSQGAQELASGSSQQAASIEQLSASLAELQEKTNNNAKDSASAREANNKTATRLEGSIRSMGEMLEAMKEIDNSSQNITRVIKVIDDIAFQTNILALNAAVEAARAGQHGKGFAVVADEVRNLAAKSAEAAKETSSLIEGSSERVKEGNEIVAKTNADLEAAVESARDSTQLIEQVASASIEQAKSINEINQGMEQISTVVQANSATAEQSAAASEEMSAQAVVMNDIVAKFKLRQEGAVRSARPGSVNASGLHMQKNGQPDASGFALTGDKY